MPTSLAKGLLCALTILTVAPLRKVGDPKRAMVFAPVVGGLLGLVVAALAWPFDGLLRGAVMVGLALLLTRGMHVDGLADTVDALGSYKPREQALAIMRSPEVGPFGVAAIVVVLLIQAVTLASLSFTQVALAFAVGRLGATIGCQRGVPSAHASGLGALVAGTVSPVWIIFYVVIFSVFNPIVLAVVALVFLVRWHIVRRLGGITGDVLGFLIELSTTLCLIGLSRIPSPVF
ncbi:adenosylcobinamide-GDP ribazoletransferase [Allorhizocola rhizosphaerae]|uniref:adenosylcobinamide-GDP ribazoletransferase n=1 Tax=Allorhizocola rhizosphaerae TaxID=1872709 RepID=UPI000E3DF2F3|nr:adenosylcobinamide-GDP ribazoletransferase [Allorhizocola rhizosphaerae]